MLSSLESEGFTTVLCVGTPRSVSFSAETIIRLFDYSVGMTLFE